jgi:hypothetical protein
MVALSSRRAIIGGACALLSPSATLHMPDNAAIAMPPAVWNPDELSQVAELICTSTPYTFRAGVFKSGGRFLYRGDDDSASDYEFGRICHPLPDLLVPGTYPEKNALAYFECLEAQLLYQMVRPSNGHVGTPTASDAAVWGNVVSIWPLGSELAYAWPRYRTAFFASDRKKQCPGDKIQLDSGIKTALLEDREILFASCYKPRDNIPSFVESSWVSAFVAVPIQYDDELRRMLRLRKYGLP